LGLYSSFFSLSFFVFSVYLSFFVTYVLFRGVFLTWEWLGRVYGTVQNGAGDELRPFCQFLLSCLILFIYLIENFGFFSFLCLSHFYSLFD